MGVQGAHALIQQLPGDNALHVVAALNELYCALLPRLQVVRQLDETRCAPAAHHPQAASATRGTADRHSQQGVAEQQAVPKLGKLSIAHLRLLSIAQYCTGHQPEQM